MDKTPTSSAPKAKAAAESARPFLRETLVALVVDGDQLVVTLDEAEKIWEMRLAR